MLSKMKTFVIICAIAVFAVLGNPATNTEWRWKPFMPRVPSSSQTLPLPAFAQEHVKKPDTPGTKAVPGCGFTKSSPRIVGGTEAVPHSYPWQVALFLDGGAARCGGSIISENWILTAAHCLAKYKTAEVVAGAHNIDEKEPTQVRRVSSHFTVHENFNPTLLYNDVGLIFLPSRLSFNENISPICLPSYSDAYLQAGTYVTATGWGRTSDDPTSASPVLKETTNQVILDSDCEAVHGAMVTGNVVCTETDGGNGICRGDSGGPLNYRSNGVTYLRGISSFGNKETCVIGDPVAFVRVVNFLDWISRKTGIAIDP